MESIFLHGLGQTPKCWDNTLSQLRPLLPHPHCPSLSGLLRGQEAAYSNLYRQLEQYCEAFTEPVGLCGLSLGAVLALQYAQQHPHRVRSLVLIGAQYKMPRFFIKLQNAVFHLLPKQTFAGMGFSKPELIRLANSMAGLKLDNGLGEISCETLVLCGERDRANRKASYELAAKLPHASLHLLPQAGHALNEDAPAALASVLNDFYRSQL